ncbi:MAG: sigma-70 family RNA polymerase sigma factor [Ignavibacteriales bacterium]|nr:sigma-70 family RNA polymerase sigma factor [Ignavibacteriales bacterium]
MQEEIQWVNKAREGDHKAFRALYDRNITPLYRFMRQFSPDVHEVEEWVQRAFIKAFQHIHSFDGKARFSTWLFRIALNEMRTDRRRASIIPFTHPDDDGISSVPSDGNESDIWEWNETMRTWMQELDETKRTVFLLYEVEGYSHAEIASMLEVSESTSRTILSRTKRYLKTRWQQEMTQ